MRRGSFVPLFPFVATSMSTVQPARVSSATVPPHMNSPSSGCATSTSARRGRSPPTSSLMRTLGVASGLIPVRVAERYAPVAAGAISRTGSVA